MIYKISKINEYLVFIIVICILFIFFPPIFGKTYLSGFEGEYHTQGGLSYFEYILNITSIPIKLFGLIFCIFDHRFSIKGIRHNKSWFIMIISLIALTQILILNISGLTNLMNLFIFFIFITYANYIFGKTRFLRIYLYYNLCILIAGLILFLINSDIVYQCFYQCNIYFFKGLYVGKNAMGLSAALIIFLSITLEFRTGFGHLIRIISLIVGALNLFLSQSITPTIALAVSLIAYYSLKNGEKYLSIAIIFILFVAAIAYSFGGFNILFEYFNRDATLSGRMLIWEESLSKIGFILLSSIGYGMSSEYVQNATLFNAVDSTWVAIYIEMGFIFCFTYVVWLIYLFYMSRHESNAMQIRSFIVFMIILSITEKISGPYIGPVILILISITTRSIDSKAYIT